MNTKPLRYKFTSLTDDEILRQHKVTVNSAEETDHAILNQLREDYFLMSM
jgi:hypothetical protein